MLRIAQHYDAKIYTAEYKKSATFQEFEGLDVEVIGRGSLGHLPYGRVAQGLNYGLSFYNLRLRNDYDVINAHVAPSHWIRNRNERVLWYCHTPLRDVYDLYRFRLSMKKAYQKPIYMVGAGVVRSIDKEVVKKIELILANSGNTRDRLRTYFKRDAQVLNGGVDYKEYKNGGDGKYFLYPSRISPNKRQLFAIKAFRIFRRAGALRNYKLVIAGAVSTDKFYKDYYDLVAREAGATPNVSVLTDISEEDLKGLYARATAVIYPPMNEDYGLVPLEAMASGKPVIAINEGGPKETVVDGETGFLINSEEEMAARMRFVAEHPAVAEKMGKAGISRAKKHYSWDKFFDGFDRALRKVRAMKD